MMTNEMEPSVTLDDVVALAQTVGRRLVAAGLKCATAESCTGGLIGHIITENPGSSDYFSGGAIVYSNAAKHRVLEVSSDSLWQFGAVSEEVAREMAVGARLLYDADVAVSVTGIAGPGGGSEGKPSGTVHIYLSAAEGAHLHQHHVWPGSRSNNKLQSARVALEMIAEYLDMREGGGEE